MTKFLSLMEAVSAPESFTVGGVKFVRISLNFDTLELPFIRIGSEAFSDGSDLKWRRTVFVVNSDTSFLRWFRKLFLSAGLEGTNNPGALEITPDSKLYDLFQFSSINGYVDPVAYIQEQLAHIFNYEMLYISSITTNFKIKGSNNKIRITSKMIKKDLENEGLSVWAGSKVTIDDYPEKNTDIFLLTNDRIYYKNQSVLSKAVKAIKKMVLSDAGITKVTPNKLIEKDPIFAKLAAKGLKLTSDFGRDYVTSKSGKRLQILSNGTEYYIQIGHKYYFFNHPDHEEIISALLENRHA